MLHPPPARAQSVARGRRSARLGSDRSDPAVLRHISLQSVGVQHGCSTTLPQRMYAAGGELHASDAVTAVPATLPSLPPPPTSRNRTHRFLHQPAGAASDLICRLMQCLSCMMHLKMIWMMTGGKNEAEKSEIEREMERMAQKSH